MFCLLSFYMYVDSRLQLKTFLLVYTKEKYNPLKVSLCVLMASSEQMVPACGWRGTGTGGPDLGLLILVPHLLHDADEILQAKHIASVWPIVHSGVIPEALEGAVCEVNHANIHFGGTGGACLRTDAAGASARATRRCHLWDPHVQVLETQVRSALPAIIDDKQRTGIETVGGLSLQHSFEASEFA